MTRPTLTQDELRQLEESGVQDVLLVMVVAGEDALTRALLRILGQSRHYAKALDLSARPTRRKDLAAKVGILPSNFNKTFDSLIEGGWLRVVETAEGLVYRRSPIVDRMLRGKTVRQWEVSLKPARA